MTAIYNHSQWAFWSVYTELVRIWALEHVYVFCSYLSINLCIVLVREMVKWMSVEMRWICLFVSYNDFLWRGLALISLSSWMIYKCYMQEHAILLCLWSQMNMLHLFGVHFCIIQYLCACVLHESLWDALYLNAPTVIHTHTQTHTAMSCLTECSGPWLALGKS